MNAIQLLEMKHNHARMRESLRVRVAILRERLADEDSRPPGSQTDFVVRQVWGSTTMILEQARPIFGDERATVALLDEVEALNNRLGRLISWPQPQGKGRHGVGKESLASTGPLDPARVVPSRA